MSECYRCKRPLCTGDDTSGLCLYCQGDIGKHCMTIPDLQHLTMSQLQARVAELETIEDEFARFRDKVWHIDNWSRHMSRGQILKDIHEMLMPYAMVVDATQKEASHEL